VLSVLLRYMDSDCPFGIYKLFNYIIIEVTSSSSNCSGHCSN